MADEQLDLPLRILNDGSETYRLPQAEEISPARMRELDGELRALETSVMMARARFARQAGLSFGDTRDMYGTLGYDPDLTVSRMYARYRRGGVTGRIVDVYPNATWRAGFEVIEDEDPSKETAFEKAWLDLARRLQINSKFLRVDKLAGLSTYAVLLIGAPGEIDQELPKGGGKPDKILYLTPFLGGGGPSNSIQSNRAVSDDIDASIMSYDEDPTSPRFGLPLTYQLKRVDFASQNLQKPVHWSRILHVAENLLADDVFGLPTLERVWNLLDDLDKVTGGGAEAFWLRANAGLHMDIDKDAQLGPSDQDAQTAINAMKAQAEDYKNQITRWIRTRGVKVQQLGSDVANFDNPADAVLTQIAGAKGIPKRILTGSEMGELASSQDRENWKDQVFGRQSGYAGPHIVRQFVDRLLDYNYLPAPVGGKDGYQVTWPQIQTLTEDERTVGAKSWAETRNELDEPVFTDAEIRDKWYGMEPLTDEQRAERDERKAAKAEQDAEAAGLKAEAMPKPVVKPFMKAALEHRVLQGDVDYKFSSTQIQIPKPIADALLSYGRSIPAFDLCEKGLEDDAHITVKYGIHTNDIGPVREALSGSIGPVRVRLGKTGVFKGDAYDVLFVEVDSPDLHELNAAVKNGVEVTDTHPTYTPHATIAYLKKDLGDRYAGQDHFEGMEFAVGTVVFSPAEGEDQVIQLGMRAAQDEELVRVLAEAIEVGNEEVVAEILALGGKGSGNFGHAGRPGQQGGSSAGEMGSFERFRNDLFSKGFYKKGDLKKFRDELFPHGFYNKGDFKKFRDQLFPHGAKLKGLEEFDADVLEILGGKGSGNFGHSGRPGQVGGSSDDGVRREERDGRSYRMIGKNGSLIGIVTTVPDPALGLAYEGQQKASSEAERFESKAEAEEYLISQAKGQGRFDAPGPYAEKPATPKAPAAPKPAGPPDDKRLSQVADAALLELKRRGNIYRDDVQGPTKVEGGYAVSVRDFGDWMVPPDEEDDGDYDWKIPTPATVKELDHLAETVQKRNPDTHVKWSNDGEKNWITIFVLKDKKATGRYLGGQGSGNFGHAGRPGQQGGSAPNGGLTHTEMIERARGGHNHVGRNIHQVASGEHHSVAQGFKHYGQEHMKARSEAALAHTEATLNDLKPHDRAFAQAFIDRARTADDMKDRARAHNSLAMIHDRAQHNVVHSTPRDPYIVGVAVQKLTATYGADWLGKLVEIGKAGQMEELLMGRLDEKLQLKAAEGIADAELVFLAEDILRTLGGPGSGNFGHKGRPGQVGGSSDDDGGGEEPKHEWIGKPIDAYPVLNPDGKDTQARYSDGKGNYTPERQKLHDEIIAKYLRGTTAVENPKVIILGGAPGVGKSTTVDREGLGKDNTVLVNPDDIRNDLPDYQPDPVTGRRPANVAFAHEEASDISAKMQRIASAGSRNILLDGTGDSSIEKLGGKVAVMRSKGATVEGMYVTTSVEESLRRADMRANNPKSTSFGRVLVPSAATAMHGAVSRVFPEAVRQGLFDRAKLFDSTGEHTLVASSEGTKLTIHNQEMWDRFIAKQSLRGPGQ